MKHTKISWYMQPWFVVLLFLSYPLYVTPILGLIFLIMYYKRMKVIKSNSIKFENLVSNGYEESIELSELIASQTETKNNLVKEIERIKKDKLELDDVVDLYEVVDSKEKQRKEIENTIKGFETDKEELEESIEELKEEYIELEDEVLLQSYGFFDPKYDLEDSESYKVRLKEIKDRQKDMVRTKEAVNYFEDWTVDGSKAEGRKMTNNMIRQALRTFNSECDIAISKVTVNNIQSMEKRIRNVFDAVNKMNETNRVNIKIDYLNLKYEELYLALEYERKKEEEKEEQRRIKEQIREEEKVRKEIEAMKKKVEKEEKHFVKELERLEKSKANASEDDLSELELKIKELQEKLNEVEQQKEDVLNRERNTRAGYVYIISNIGSFGEDIYKIGVTRRLTPMDRIRELSSASVPFQFDVHAMIFSDDAPTLENTLHKTFRDQRVNVVNERKEFFHISLDEIQKVIEKNHDKTVEFKTTALAEEFRESKALREKVKQKTA